MAPPTPLTAGTQDSQAPEACSCGALWPVVTSLPHELSSGHVGLQALPARALKAWVPAQGPSMLLLGLSAHLSVSFSLELSANPESFHPSHFSITATSSHTVHLSDLLSLFTNIRHFGGLFM